MSTSAKQLNVNGDTKLALSIVVLWSIGRVLNPLRHFAENTVQGVDVILSVATAMYVALHIVVFVYTVLLLAGSIRKHGFKLRGKLMWEVVLYVYVFAALLISLYFIAYEFNFLPMFLSEPVSSLFTS